MFSPPVLLLGVFGAAAGVFTHDAEGTLRPLPPPSRHFPLLVTPYSRTTRPLRKARPTPVKKYSPNDPSAAKSCNLFPRTEVLKCESSPVARRHGNMLSPFNGQASGFNIMASGLIKVCSLPRKPHSSKRIGLPIMGCVRVFPLQRAGLNPDFSSCKLLIPR
jgi:hypothetical protein